MIDNLSQQQRMLLAIVLSFLFFIVYESFMPRPKIADINKTKSYQLNQTNKEAPAIQNSNLGKAPSTKSTTASSVEKSKVITTIKSDRFMAKIDELGRVSHFRVLIDKFEDKDGNYPDIISKEQEVLPFEIRFNDPATNEEAFKIPYKTNAKVIDLNDGSKTLILTQELTKTTVTKEITFHKDGNFDLKVSLSNDMPFFITNGTRPQVETDRYTFNGALLRYSDGKLETIDDGDAEEKSFSDVTISASVNKYYTSSFYNFDKSFTVAISKDEKDDPIPFIKANGLGVIHGYIGPKEYDILKSIDPRLTDVIEYGFFTFISKPLFIALKAIYNFVGNWGWAIVIITIVLRLFLYPLTYKGMVSMNKLKELSPKIKEIQAKYKKEPQKMNAKMMELYKKHGANPMGGCLPMLLQIPIFFAIYRVLLNTVELKHAPWIGWINDLSIMDPYFILPILMGGTMYWQQRLTPSNFTDPMQEKIMKFLPLVFTFFFVTFPAGLTLYWFVNNLFSVAQQYYVNSIFEKEKAKRK